MAALIRRVCRREEGAELIEMAVITPLLLLLIMGIVDFGFMFQQYLVLTNAAAEGARVGSLPGYSADDVAARVEAYATNGGVVGAVNTSTEAVALAGSSGGSWPGTQVTVTHVYTFDYLGPIAELFSAAGLESTVTLTSRATMRNQVAAAPAP